MRPTGKIHGASAASPRLRAMLDLLRRCGGAGATTREIIRETGICAVNAVAAELRAAGFPVHCAYERTTDTKAQVYRYTLLDAAGRVA